MLKLPSFSPVRFATFTNSSSSSGARSRQYPSGPWSGQIRRVAFSGSHCKEAKGQLPSRLCKSTPGMSEVEFRRGWIKKLDCVMMDHCQHEDLNFAFLSYAARSSSIQRHLSQHMRSKWRSHHSECDNPGPPWFQVFMTTQKTVYSGSNAVFCFSI
jgi:hypothetical protein